MLQGIGLQLRMVLDSVLFLIFLGVYASSRPQWDDITKGTESLQQVVDVSMVRDLLQPYVEAEVTKTLFRWRLLNLRGPMSAFIPGRLITDNVLLAFEMNHFLSTKEKGGQGWMALKLDVSKAYDKGRKINFSKSSVVFSKNTKKESCFGTIRRENRLACYLGLPSGVARSKRDFFATIRDKVCARILGWNAKLLSQDGHEVLIKSII
ncbi:UNVERIFIED_CONTAM: hypothetical protein Sradi_3153100 [Sesamum radiatum]|uniref:Reverse transcriptase n=1 Tax=Sesamum radiatum TaxID=300843 RepID=A0AAW2RG27_SESRA